MNNPPSPPPPPPPPPPPILNLRTTAHVIKQAASSFSSSLFTFLYLSLLLFSFRAIVENGSHFVTSFIDRDPSLKALLSRLDIAGNNLQAPGGLAPSAAAAHRRHRRPFLHLTRVGTLDDDFFSGDDDDDRSLFGTNRKTQINGSFVRLGFSNFAGDSGIRVSEIVHPGFSFRTEGLSFDADGNDDNAVDEADGGNGSIGLEKEENRAVDLQFFIRGLELGRRDAAVLFFFVSFLSAAYGWVILGFLVTYSWVLGIVFVAVVNDLLGRYSSCVGNIWDGSRLGIKRLSGLILMRWAVRDAVTQLLGLWFFGEIEDQYSFFRLFVRLKLMPFSVMSPWVRGFEKEISGFLFAWFLVDTCVSFIFAIDSWVAIVDSRRTGREIMKEGCYLLSTMMNQAVQIKCLEAIFSGSFVRWGLQRVCGKLFAAVFQSVVEVYFMVAWLIFYLATRCKDASSNGRRFGQRELEGFFQGLR
ncbi:uncharacterized protein LOC131167924 [Malania oleifera]|uniref:uncharacterized protein LOC131167924 n=1 Tax=Malania oleifera TaxID=397392 RepID=UPI0025ADE727|nr:uncharacterized protein LOC131167924 [Malania oleifera]